MLTGSEIKKRIDTGDICITDFNECRLNPNSYNLRLHNELIVYTEPILYTDRINPSKRFIIPEEGYLLLPGTVYLGRTVEVTETNNLVPMLDGRSSTARLGMFVHCTGGVGDIGFKGHWTLEIVVTHPTMIFPGIEICQISYHEITGQADILYKGKYQNNTDIQISMLYKDNEIRKCEYCHKPINKNEETINIFSEGTSENHILQVGKCCSYIK